MTVMPFAHTRQAGFTMLELIVVIVIMGLIAALSPPIFSSGVTAAEQKAASRSVAQTLRLARSEAIAQGKDMAVDFDLAARTFSLAGSNKLAKLPEGLALELTTTAAETRDDARASIRFYPDGGSTGGRVTLTHKERKLKIDIDWLTGRVAIDEA